MPRMPRAGSADWNWSAPPRTASWVPAERAELDRLLEENPDAREFQADLRKLESFLADIPSPDMPETLHGDIMARIPATQRPVQRPVTTPARSTFGWLRAPTPVFRYGLATAAGVLLAAIIYESPLTFSPATDRGDLVGTMAPAGSRSEPTLSIRMPSARTGSRPWSNSSATTIPCWSRSASTPRSPSISP